MYVALDTEDKSRVQVAVDANDTFEMKPNVNISLLNNFQSRYIPPSCDHVINEYIILKVVCK